NPAYAGSKEYLSMDLLYRDQWLNWGNRYGSNNDLGAPITQTLSIHGPWKERVGLGMNLVNDVIGARNTTSLNFSYAYRIDFGVGKLAIGLQGGMIYWRAKWDNLRFKDAREIDEAFDNGNPSMWIPSVGAGAYYHSDYFYVGVSVPNLINFKLRDAKQQVTRIAQLYRHFYFTAGGAIPLNGDDLVFKPSLLIKAVGFLGDFTGSGANLNDLGAPTEFDIDLSLFFLQKIWFGASFRSSFEAIINGKSTVDSADIWMAYYLKNGLRIGMAYDYPLTPIRTMSPGSLEVLLGYDFNYRMERMSTPRYF
ncbi:MAG: type IX secretion system membrane protein PorP/SprF, partial [Bacteroidetes bacterium]|nr:type IX secretion system membrane protein PorP/SprF [Bacteroidota bacterium]